MAVKTKASPCRSVSGEEGEEEVVMTYEKLARTLDQVLADNVRLKRERDEAVRMLEEIATPVPGQLREDQRLARALLARLT